MSAITRMLDAGKAPFGWWQTLITLSEVFLFPTPDWIDRLVFRRESKQKLCPVEVFQLLIQLACVKLLALFDVVRHASTGRHENDLMINNLLRNQFEEQQKETSNQFQPIFYRNSLCVRRRLLFFKQQHSWAVFIDFWWCLRLAHPFSRQPPLVLSSIIHKLISTLEKYFLGFACLSGEEVEEWGGKREEETEIFIFLSRFHSTARKKGENFITENQLKLEAHCTCRHPAVGSVIKLCKAAFDEFPFSICLSWLNVVRVGTFKVSWNIRICIHRVISYHSTATGNSKAQLGTGIAPLLFMLWGLFVLSKQLSEVFTVDKSFYEWTLSHRANHICL